MKLRMQHCVDVITERLTMLELTWSDATHIDLCVAQDIPGLMAPSSFRGCKAQLRVESVCTLHARRSSAAKSNWSAGVAGVNSSHRRDAQVKETSTVSTLLLPHTDQLRV